MIISCHQPNFFPWVPYFEKIQQSDKFIILENVQFTRHQFQNRFEYLGKWKTMPVQQGHLEDLIKDKKYVDPASSWTKIKNSLPNEKLTQYDDLIKESLSDTNSGIIHRICQELSITTPISKDTKSVESSASQKLLDICLVHGATTYLSGPSGKNYLNEEIFRENGIKVKYFEATRRDSILTVIGE